MKNVKIKKKIINEEEEKKERKRTWKGRTRDFDQKDQKDEQRHIFYLAKFLSNNLRHL